MFYPLKRSPIVYVLVLSVAVGTAITAFTAAMGSTPVSGKDFAYQGRSEPPPPLPALSGQVVKITEQVTRGPTEKGFEGGDSWVTETLAEIDQNGLMVRFRSITTGQDGKLRQDQLYESGSEVVNSMNWMETGQSCSETLAVGDIGSGIPTVDSDSLVSRGFTLIREVEGTQTWQAQGPVVSGYQSTVQEVFVDSGYRYDLGSQLTGTTPDGSTEVIYSRHVRIEAAAVTSGNPFTIEPLGPCPGHKPDGNVQKEADR